MSATLLLMVLETAQAQDAPSAEAPPSEDGARPIAIEPAFGLTLPAGGLSMGPGVQATVAFPIGERFELGPAVVLRLPSGADGDLEDPALASPLAWESRLWSTALAARGALQIPIKDDLAGSVGLDLGAAMLSQRTAGGAGDTVEQALAPWISPRVGMLIGAGPGDVAVHLAVHFAPSPLLVTGGNVGGTGLTLAVGYRFGV